VPRDRELASSSRNGRCTRNLQNAPRNDFREVRFPWHPWFGLRVGLHEAIERSSGVVFRCTLSSSDVDRGLEIPGWMFDRSVCARVSLMTDSQADLTALTTLAALLRQVLNGGVASSNASLSRVSILGPCLT
jgi:hypothetical protein